MEIVEFISRYFAFLVICAKKVAQCAVFKTKMAHEKARNHRLFRHFVPFYHFFSHIKGKNKYLKYIIIIENAFKNGKMAQVCFNVSNAKKEEHMDFYRIIEKKHPQKNVIEVSPEFIVQRSKDLMVRGKSFYAIWDNEKQIWSTDECDVARLVDEELREYQKRRRTQTDASVKVKFLSNFSSGSWSKYKMYLSQMFDNHHQLDASLTFANTKVKKTDYISKRLLYSLEEGSIEAYEELMSVIYNPTEREKLEWAVGSIVANESKLIQKFIVLYGEPGSGKSTFLNIVQKLFEGYYILFEAKALVGANNTFATQIFRDDPLVAIQHDGDLSKIEDNTKLNSITSHEKMLVQEKFKAPYETRMNCFLFLGTNKPVKITDSNSGMIRRLIDVSPSGNKIPSKKYDSIISRIDFELGAIAHHCLKVYQRLGKNYYSQYKPLDMMFKTDVFFNFIEEYYYIFEEQDGITLKQAYSMYKTYCDETLIEFKLPLYKFREELKSYFKKFEDRPRIEGKLIRSYYSGFMKNKIKQEDQIISDNPYLITIDETVSILDDFLKDCRAQYTKDDETPLIRWSDVKTNLGEIDTHILHYVRAPSNLIMIDFDLKDSEGNKSVNKNLEAASKWPATYAEFSKGGAGVHLHYIYEGDVTKLNNIYKDGIEVKTFCGKSSLRRKLTKCNSLPIATINGGLPLKGEKKVINFDVVKNESAIRSLITRNINKEIHPGTKPSVDFIFKILEDAYNSGAKYDVTDMRPKILAFANNSTHHADSCIKLVNKMKFASEESSSSQQNNKDGEIVFFDVEVFPNLFIVCWKVENKSPVKMINPTSLEIEELMKFKLIGFNCRRYDNHILYGRYIGYDNLQLYNLSQKIISESRNSLFGEAYNVSYTDVYDFSSKKQSLKKFEIELGIHHQELGLPWDEPVPEELWDKVADYCINDVIATEAVFNNRKQDFIARKILADLSGLTVNDTTQMHTAKIIFGNDKRPQDKFIYTDLSEMFPGYTYDNGVSTYRDEETGEGGYVYSEPGMYSDVAVLDIASMHPTSLVRMNMFGPYTKNFEELLDARIEIKHDNYEAAKNMLSGILSKYLENEEDSSSLAYALKIVINIVYGLTSAKFENKFKDPRNKDNIVAKRGALFMIDLKHAVQDRGFSVVHIKTDSIKIPNATQDIIDFVFEFGKKYGYTFEHEDTYKRFCLVNDAVYIAHKGWDEPKFKNDKYIGPWTSTGAQFSHPYIFKKLFSKEDITFEDMCEIKSVSSALYLDMNENLSEDEHDYHFIGKTSSFCPIKEGCNGGVLLREKDKKFYAVTGTKGYRWLEAEMVRELNRGDDINEEYYVKLVESAVKDISKFGDFEWFISGEGVEKIDDLIGFDDVPVTCEYIKDGNHIITCKDCKKSNECDALPF